MDRTRPDRFLPWIIGLCGALVLLDMSAAAIRNPKIDRAHDVP